VFKIYSLISKYNQKEKRMKRTILFIIAVCLCFGLLFNDYSQARGKRPKPQQKTGRPGKRAERISQRPRAAAPGQPLDAAAWSAARRDVETDSPPPALLPVIEMARAGTFVDKWFVPWVADKTLARSAEGLGGQTYTFRTNPTDEAVDYYLAPLVSTPQRKAQVHAYAVALEPTPLTGIESALKQCAVPTRIVWGTGDDIFSGKSPDYLHQILPQSRGVRRVEGAKLFFPEEFPDIIADEARRLWARR
jgi:pimeloyl-ACP methyl ester carboxylesterase